MQRYFFVLCDELGDEFDISVNAPDFETALAKVESNYPESSVAFWDTAPYVEHMATHIVRESVL